MAKIIIDVKKGRVSGVQGHQELEVHIRDYDTHGIDLDRIKVDENGDEYYKDFIFPEV